MGGGGSMGAANSRIKYNRSLVGKRNYKDVKKLILNTSGKTELEFKQLNSIELSKIKEQIRLKAYKKKQKNTLLLIGLFLIIASIIGAYSM